MKKVFFLFSMVLILTLCACGGKTPGNTSQDSTTEKPQFEKTETILKDKKPVDEKGVLSYIHNQYVEGGIQQQIFNFQENILLCSSSYNGETGESALSLKLISTQNGELICKREYKNIDMGLLQILDRHIAFSDYGTGRLIVLNSRLETEKEYTMPSGSVFLNKKMTKAYVISYEKGILAVDLKDGSSKQFIDEISSAYVSKVCGDSVSITYTDRVTGLSSYAVLNLAGEEVDILDLDKSFYGVEHNSRFWLAGMIGDMDQYFYGTENAPQTFHLESGAMASLVKDSDKIMVTKVQSDSSMDFYAYHPDGTFYSAMNLPGGELGYMESIVWFESLGGYLLTNIEAPGLDKLYFWDVSVPTTGEDLTFTELATEVPAGDAVDLELYEKAENIGEKYGVTIKIAEQCETKYDSYTVEQNMDEDKIARGLELIDKSLASYPDGFLKQLHFGYFREIELNLMGSISALNQVEENKNGFDSFIAFVEQKDERYTIIFDLSRGQMIEQDLYHEFSHIIDKKLQNMVDNEKKVKYSEEGWAALNPKGFQYCQSYTDVPDSYYYDGNEDYFIDIYSRTFPSEDRARVMEYAMIGAEFCFDTYPGLVEKLRYYSECIRDGFDTTGWPEVTKWEEMLFLVD